LEKSPATGLRILVLDDILIGLDMSNRVKIIDLVKGYFKEWQIIILTYSKGWFERLKDHVNTPGWSADWQSVVLWEEWRDQDPSPRVVVEGSGDLIKTAREHLKKKDYTAAAVYARKAFEKICHEKCAKASRFVLHVASPKDRKVEHYWSELKPRMSEIVDDGRRTTALILIAKIEQAREFVLNRNAHFDVDEEDTLSGEVGAAIDAVKDLFDFLEAQPWANEDFHSGRTISPVEQMNAALKAARELAAKLAKRQCQNSLKSAFYSFWFIYGKQIEVLLPIGSTPTSSGIWQAAKTQGKIPTADEVRLDTCKAYLFGCVKTDAFDLAKFEEAATLLEELSSVPIISATAIAPAAPQAT
jgi:hypothetical protein